MKKQLMIALGLAALSLPALAAAADFSGTYVRDAKASDANYFPLYWITRDFIAPGGGGGETVVVVKQTPSSLQITDPARAIRNLPLDGQPHVVTAETGVVKQTVTASVQGDNLVVATVMPYAGMPGGITLNANDTWSLSRDGKVLTVTTVRSTPAAPRETSKQVYNRR